MTTQHTQEEELIKQFWKLFKSNIKDSDQAMWPINDYLRQAFKAIKGELAEDICKLIDDIEFNHKDTSMEEWKQYKHIRNAIRDKYVLHSDQEDVTNSLQSPDKSSPHNKTE